MNEKILANSLSINDDEDNFVLLKKAMDLPRVSLKLSNLQLSSAFMQMFLFSRKATRLLSCLLLQELLVETKQNFANVVNKLTTVHSIGVGRTGNGARRNWNCDRLLKEFATTTNMSRKNVASSHHGIYLKFKPNGAVKLM